MVNKYILSPLPISFVCAFARGPSVRGDRKTDIRINIIQPINIRQKTPGWQQEQLSYQCTRGGATEIDTATCQNVAGNQPVSYRYPTTYKPYLRVAMPECDRLAFSPLCIKSLKSPPPRHRSYHINQDRRPAMHEQRHWNSRWVRPLSLKNQCSTVLGDKNDLLYCILPASSHRANKLPESPNSPVQCTDNNKQ